MPDTDLYNPEDPEARPKQFEAGYNPQSPAPTAGASAPSSDYDITKPYLGLMEKYRPQQSVADQETQRRIAKGNALAGAFKLMVDAVGGSKGANIVPLDTNPVMAAVDKYHKLREDDKNRQAEWDKMEMGAGLNALNADAQKRYEAERLKQSEAFTAGQQEKEQALRVHEGELNRALEEKKMEQEADQFSRSLTQKEKSEKDQIAAEYARIAEMTERHSSLHPYGEDKGLVISDAEIGQQVIIPKNKTSQVLAMIAKDPVAQKESEILMMKYGNLPSQKKVDYMIAELYPSLDPKTRTAIRHFLGSEQPAPKAGESYDPNVGPLRQQAPEAPTITTDKSSTMVKVTPAGGEGQNALSPEIHQYIATGLKNPNFTPAQKRSGLHNYLIHQGLSDQNATEIANEVYSTLVSNQQ